MICELTYRLLPENFYMGYQLEPVFREVVDMSLYY